MMLSLAKPLGLVKSVSNRLSAIRLLSKEAPEAGSNKKVDPAAPGEGIRSLQTSSIFRAVNFELYAKPNRYMIGFGIFAFTLSIIYLVSWRTMAKSAGETYTAMNDDDSLVVKKKKSKWE